MTSTETIVALCSGITGIVVSVAGLRRTHYANVKGELEECSRAQEQLQGRFLTALQHVFYLEQVVVHFGGQIPPRPHALAPEATTAAWYDAIGRGAGGSGSGR